MSLPFAFRRQDARARVDGVCAARRLPAAPERHDGLPHRAVPCRRVCIRRQPGRGRGRWLMWGRSRRQRRGRNLSAYPAHPARFSCRCLNETAWKINFNGSLSWLSAAGAEVARRR